MSYLLPDDTIQKQRESGTVGDLLAFEAWPEESQRIARGAIALEETDKDDLEEARIEGREEMCTEADDAYNFTWTRVLELKRAIEATLPKKNRDALLSILNKIPQTLDTRP